MKLLNMTSAEKIAYIMTRLYENKLTTNAVIVEDSEAPAPPEPTTRLIDSQTSEVF